MSWTFGYGNDTGPGDEGFSEWYDVVDNACDRYLGRVSKKEDAEMVCRALNSHDELVAALKARIADWDSCTAPGAAAAEGCPDPHDVALARAAIAKANGGEA